MSDGVAECKLLNRNWVLKRKRRRIVLGKVSSNDDEKADDASDLEPLPDNSDSLRKMTSEPSLSSKMKGDDGYYYECAICDLGGNLLCCDNCPQVYHLQCLDPPLKRIPNGKWQCPNCCKKSSPLRNVNSLGSVSKRARSKVMSNSKDGTPSSNKVRLSQTTDTSIVSEPTPSGKAKIVLRLGLRSSEKNQASTSGISCNDKANESNSAPLENGSLIPIHKDVKLVESSKGITGSTSGSPGRGSQEDATVLESEIKIADLESEGSQQHTVLTVRASRSLGRKRKQENVNNGSLQVKAKRSSAKKSSEKLATPALNATKSSQNKDSNNPCHRKENAALKSSKLKTKKAPEIDSSPLVGSDHTSREGTLTCRDNLSADLQVDQVLGCRFCLRTCDVAAADGLPFDEQFIQDNREKHVDKNIVKQSSDKDIITRTENTAETTNVYKRCLTRAPKDMVSSTDCPNLVSVMNEEFERSLDVDVKENSIRELVSTMANSQLPSKINDVSEISSDTKGSSLDKKPAPGSEQTSEDSYEYLVKWVGKSHLNNSWIPESQLKLLAKRKLDNFKGKYGTAIINICDERWKIPERVICIRKTQDGAKEAFIKWMGLPYNECTWELVNDSFLARSSHLIDLYNQFEKRALENDLGKPSTKNSNEIVGLTRQPKELTGGLLFPHQLEALNWLRRCWNKSKNVILADEMGLGKTISACAFISSLYFEFKAARPCLVLVPLSTMPNWHSEFSLWAPNINVVAYHGSAKARGVIRQFEWHSSSSNVRSKNASFRFNVLLTTYEMILSDASFLRGIPWEVLVVDEGHRLKNAESKLFSLLNTFSFQHRVLLTGTPLQNNVGEMFNLLNFLLPSSFPSLSAFEERFNNLSTTEKVEELKKLVTPHMLRRLKKDAMQNIPPKTERMVPVELTSVQAEYYRAMLTKNYQLLRTIGKGAAQQSMLNVVMQLRKICNHPYLIPGTEPESGTVEFLHEMRIKASAKLTLLHSMLKSLQKDCHRVLIFSQMTKLLDILEDYLTIEFGPKTYERVDGSVSVSDRQSAINRFNTDKSRFVFLLSTRACGLGINLATADTVIIYDSDFNPHADIQAMNRAHRIGQSNRLLVYRLVVRASVEERILQLAKKKLMLDQLFVNKSGSQKEVEDILRWGTEELFGDSSRKDGSENEVKRDDLLLDLEQKRRKRGGGLGDVYKDKCADGENKIVWDDNTIAKLLDRSTLLSGANDAEAESESDMLGSVKASEWNEETTDEQGKSESPQIPAEDTCGLINERKDDKANDWDRLLKLRWEKYQTEEEAALGRGKRQRKAVSYREAFSSNPTAPTESGCEEEKEPEPEPLEYSAAGRALKAKYCKLRQRQKERLAKLKLAKGPPIEQANIKKERERSPQLLREEAPSAVSSDENLASDENVGRKGKLQTIDANEPIDPSLPLPSSFRNRTILKCMKRPNNFGPEFPFSFPPLPLFSSPSLELSHHERLHHLNAPSSSQSNFPSFLPNLSLQTGDLPPLPKFNANRQPFQPETEAPPMGLRRIPSLPENHRKVLENIMMRTSNPSNLSRKKPRSTGWTEDELDFLWIGVRRHGLGNWEALLNDQWLRFSKHKTPHDLAVRWEEEQRMIFDKPMKPVSKFQPHLTDMKLGFPDLMPHWKLNQFRPGDSSAGTSAGDVQFPFDSFGLRMNVALRDRDGEYKGNYKGKDAVDKLPHWLREAVTASSKLPPNVSAIAKSVRLLYGDEKPAIPPFVVPPPLPLQPQDPRRVLGKKKRRSRPRKPFPADVAEFRGDSVSSSDTSLPAMVVDGKGGHGGGGTTVVAEEDAHLIDGKEHL